MPASTEFLEARDQLLRAREDWSRARREFRWPALTHFNWARDYFDVVARANVSPALRLVDDAGGDESYSFEQIARRSCQVAAFLAHSGLEPGDRILLMLPNTVSLWEVMLAAIRLGAVVIPATTLLERDDLIDRIERGRVKAIITESGLTGRFAGLAGAPVRIAVGTAAAGWASYAASHGFPDSFTGPATHKLALCPP